MHGGANEATIKMLREIGSVDGIPSFVEKVKNKETKLMGLVIVCTRVLILVQSKSRN